MANFSFLDSTGLTTLWAKIKNTFVASSTKGVAGGVASLDNSGKVPSSQLPTYPTVNNGNLYLQAGGVTKITFTANQSTDSTFNIAEGSTDGTIAVGGTNVSVKGLKALAYKQSLVESDIPALSISKITNLQTSLNNKLETSLKGAASGLAELDSGGKVPTSQLPSYVDDVLEYASKTNFPSTGEAGKIYVALDTNLTYRWSGSAYVEISPSLALGETSSTAYRGDKGKTAYDHATDASRLTTAQTSGFYKFATTAEGHIASVTAVTASDLTSLIGSTTYAPYNANGYLPLAGETMNAGAQIVIGSVVRTYPEYTGGIQLRELEYGGGDIADSLANAPGISFHWSNNNAQKLYMNKSGQLYWGSNTIIHSGNIGSQSVNYATSAGSAGNADTLDGHHNGDVIAIENNFRVKTYNDSFNFLDDDANRLVFYKMTGVSDNCPYIGSSSYPYGYLMNFSWEANSWSGQLYYTVSDFESRIFTRGYRGDTNSWTSWNQVAFVTDTVASANTLATQRSLWGQLFDGSANVSGAMTGVTNIDSLLYFDTTNNRIGIGTATPAYALHITGSNTPSTPVARFTVSGTGAWQRGIQLFNTEMAAGDSLMYSVGYGDNARNMGQLYFYFAGDGSTSNRLALGLHSVDDVLNICGNGNVGIGTTSPAYKLDVNGDIFTSGKFIASNGTSDTIFRAYNTSSSVFCDFGVNIFGQSYIWSSNASPIVIGNNGTTAVYIDTSQRVGIGTTAPTYKLDVNGGLRAGDAILGISTSIYSRCTLLLNSPANTPADIIFRSGSYTNGTWGDWSLSSRGNENGSNNSFYISRGGYNDGTPTESSIIGVHSNGRVIIGQQIYGSTPVYQLHVIGDIYANGGWLRTSGAAGWYSETYGGGWYCDDTTYVKTYGSRSIYTASDMVAGGSITSVGSITSTGGGVAAYGISDLSMSGGGGGGTVAGIKFGSDSAITPDNNGILNVSAIPASVITQDATHRMVSDSQVSTWDSKQDALAFDSSTITKALTKKGTFEDVQLALVGGSATSVGTTIGINFTGKPEVTIVSSGSSSAPVGSLYVTTGPASTTIWGVWQYVCLYGFSGVHTPGTSTGWTIWPGNNVDIYPTSDSTDYFVMRYMFVKMNINNVETNVMIVEVGCGMYVD